MEFKLPKKTLTLWRIRIVLIFALPLAVLAFFYGFSYWFIIASVILLLLAVLVVFVYLPLYFKNFALTVDNGAVVVECGVIIKVTHIMPFPRLIYTSSYSTPLGQLLKLSGITVKAARSRLILPEFENDVTQKLLNEVKNRE